MVPASWPSLFPTIAQTNESPFASDSARVERYDRASSIEYGHGIEFVQRAIVGSCRSDVICSASSRQSGRSWRRGVSSTEIRTLSFMWFLLEGWSGDQKRSCENSNEISPVGFLFVKRSI